MKKIVSLVIVITMMLCMFPVSSMTASATTTDFQQVDLTGKADYDRVTVGDITYSVICSDDAFYNIKNAKGSAYILANDIDLDNASFNRPVFFDESAFTGILNGNGYSVYNFSVNYTAGYGSTGMLFQSLGANAIVENLTIGTAAAPVSYTLTGSNVTSAGVLAGVTKTDMTNDNTVTVSNVDIYCNISFAYAKAEGVNIGGFIGRTHTAGNVDIIDSSFTGSISVADAAAVSGYNTRAGGFVGFCQSGGTLDIEDSVNNAAIDITKRESLSSSNYSYAGGFVGRFEGNCNFTNCINNGNIISDKASGGIAASGINDAIFTSCVNTGNVTSDLHSGGILGMAYFGNTSTKVFEFDSCVNHGDVSAVSATDSTRKTRAGGILGVTNSGIYKIDGCGNTGNISASGVSNDTLCASGIVGNMGWITDATNSSYVTNCYSTGTIASTLTNDSRTYKTYAIFSGTTNSSSEKVKAANNVWNMTFGGNAVTDGVAHNFTSDSINNTAKNILAKETSNDFEAYVQKSNDNTKIRVVLLTEATELDANTNVVVKVWCGDSGKQFTVSASKIFALESVDAAGEIYYGVGGAYIFGAVVTGIPESVMATVTDVTVEYGSYSADFDMTE